MSDNIKKVINVEKGVLKASQDNPEIIHVNKNDLITSQDYNTIQRILTEILVKHDHYTPVTVSFQNAIDGKKYEYTYQFQPPPYIMDIIVIEKELTTSSNFSTFDIGITRSDILSLLDHYDLEETKENYVVPTLIEFEASTPQIIDISVTTVKIKEDRKTYKLILKASESKNVKIKKFAVNIKMKVISKK